MEWEATIPTLWSSVKGVWHHWRNKSHLTHTQNSSSTIPNTWARIILSDISRTIMANRIIFATVSQGNLKFNLSKLMARLHRLEQFWDCWYGLLERRSVSKVFWISWVERRILLRGKSSHNLLPIAWSLSCYSSGGGTRLCTVSRYHYLPARNKSISSEILVTSTNISSIVLLVIPGPKADALVILRILLVCDIWDVILFLSLISHSKTIAPILVLESMRICSHRSHRGYFLCTPESVGLQLMLRNVHTVIILI